MIRFVSPITAIFLSLVFSNDSFAEKVHDFVETPKLLKRVQSGSLPPVENRIPYDAKVLYLGKGFEPGRHGGTLRLLMGRKKDTRQLVVYGYARLVGYNSNFQLVPDLLKDYHVSEGRIFTFHLRKGHKWSDGHPFTAEDFRYYFEDVATSNIVTNESLPLVMLVEGRAPKFEIIDQHTIRYTWHKPNPYFLQRLAGSRPIYLYRPSHYLKKFHLKYSSLDILKKLVKKAKKRNWMALHYLMSRQYKNVNPDLPSLQPWVLVTKPPAKRFTFSRNPYFHRVDTNGRQLPYIDQVKVNVTNSKLIPMKSGSGESDLQARGLNFTNYTLLKRSEKKFGYRTYLWRTAKGARWAIYPNLNSKDKYWRKLFRDVRFRRALSIAVDRHEINQVFYYGLARETNNSILRESPLFKEKYTKRWSEFDLEKANSLLDELGLLKRNKKGLRLLSNGKPMEITIVFSTEESEPADILELITDTWGKIGIRVLSKPLNREVMRNRIFSGKALMSIWSGLENGIPNDTSSPAELAPTSQQQLQWSAWGQYNETSGKAGDAIDMTIPQRLFDMVSDWRVARSKEIREKIWHRMLELYSDQVYSIGVIASVPQVVLANGKLRNFPKEAIYNWDPGAHFGIYRPDSFWFVK